MKFDRIDIAQAGFGPGIFGSRGGRLDHYRDLGLIPAFAVELLSRSTLTSDLETATPSGYPALRLALKGQHWDWLAR